MSARFRIGISLVAFGALAVLAVAASGSTPAPATAATASIPSPAPAVVARPARPGISIWPIPFGAKRKREMAAYSQRHYGEHSWRLRDPQVIVEHMAQTSSAGAVYSTFAPDLPDVELHELPNVCSHFVVANSGRIFRLVNLRTRCRHTVGLNWTAIGIEHVGYADSDVLDDSGQLRASLRLTQWLRCKFRIPVRDVIGHAESLSSPFHRERVPSLRHQTHGDWKHAAMRVYRRKLARLGSC